MAMDASTERALSCTVAACVERDPAQQRIAGKGQHGERGQDNDSGAGHGRSLTLLLIPRSRHSPTGQTMLRLRAAGDSKLKL
jgi:hypothetical protein